MRQCLSITFNLAIALLSCSVVGLAAEAIKSGPQQGEPIAGPFHILNINGEHAGNLHCLVCEYGLKPTVVVFAHDSATGNKALGTLLQKLDEAVGRNKNARLRSFVVFLSEEFPKEEGRKDVVLKLQKLATDLELKQVILTVDGPTGPENYKLSKEAEVTVLVYRNHKVMANFTFAKDKLEEKDVGAMLDEVTKVVGAKK